MSFGAAKNAVCFGRELLFPQGSTAAREPRRASTCRDKLSMKKKSSP
jgi:hypothetical protein